MKEQFPECQKPISRTHCLVMLQGMKIKKAPSEKYLIEILPCFPRLDSDLRGSSPTMENYHETEPQDGLSIFE